MRKTSRTPPLLAALAALLGCGLWFALSERPPARGEGVSANPRFDLVETPGPGSVERPPPAAADSSAPARELALEAPASASGDPADLPAAPIEGRVTDRITGAGIGDCEVGIVQVLVRSSQLASPIPGARSTSGQVIRLGGLARTDASGHFRSPRPLPAGEYRLQLMPERCTEWSERDVTRMSSSQETTGSVRISHLHRPGAEDASPARIQVLRGPAYRFDLGPSPALPTCELRVQLGHELEEDWHLPPASEGGPRAGLIDVEPPTHADLRDGPSPWTRFPFPLGAPLAAHPPPWTITVASPDGSYVGSAAVHSIQGECEDVVALRLTRRGALDGVVRRASGNPVEGARVLLEPLRPGRFADYEGRARTSGDGRYSLRALPPGPARLFIEVEGCAPHIEELVIEAGPPVHHDVQLDLVQPGILSGILRTAQGDISPIPALELRSPAAPAESARTGRVYPISPGLAAFEFRDVPPGEYELLVRSIGPHTWRPERQRVTAPGDGIELLRDEDPLLMLLLEARSAEDQRPLARFSVWLAAPDGLRHEAGTAGNAIIDRVPAGDDSAFALAAPGHDLLWARTGELERNGRFRVGVFELQPGFSARLRVLLDSSMQPVEGARVLIDGAAVARTDARGEALIGARALPSSLTVEHAGHVLVDDDLSAGRRGLDDPGEALVFRLRAER